MMGKIEHPWIEDSFDTVHQFIGILDRTGKIKRINHAGLNLIGATHEQVKDIPVWSIPWKALKRQDRSKLKMAVQRANDGFSTRSKFLISSQEELVKAIDFSIQPVFHPDQSVKFLLIEGQDVSDYHNTSAALSRSEARFKTIFEESGIGIVIKAEDGKMLDCNPAFQNMLGYSPNELLKREYLDITHPYDIAASRKLFNELISGKRRNYFLEKRYIRKDGQIVWGRMAASLMRSQDGEEKFVIGLVENITSNKQIEAELSELQHRLMQGKDNERLRLAQDLHDGPLQEIIGVVYQIQELENSIRDPAEKEQAKEIRTSLQQVMWSVRTICGELRPPTLVPFGLEKTILSHIERFRTIHPELSITWKLAHDGLTLPENVRTAFFRIYQEALNNISRHAHAKHIKIIFRLTPKKAVLEIIDDGVGFDLPDHWVKLARQGHLGLVGAVERAKDIGGTLDVITAKEQGTKIKVSVNLSAIGNGVPEALEEIRQ